MNDRFSKLQQHDCHEFIRYYLEQVQDEQNPIPAKKQPIMKNSEEAWSYYLNSHTSIVDLLFAGQLTNLVKCSGCENVTLTH